MQKQRPGRRDNPMRTAREGEWARTGGTHGRCAKSKAEDSRRTAQQLMRYRINNNATDVGGQRTTVAWDVGCAQI